MRPIDADALIERINYSFYPYERVRIDTITGCFLTEDCAPTVDVEPVRHGHWIICSDGYYPYCSKCKQEPSGKNMTNYCSNCGAKMDEIMNDE